MYACTLRYVYLTFEPVSGTPGFVNTLKCHEDLQAEIVALQVKVQHLYTHAVQQLENEENVVKAGEGNERERATAATTDASGSYVAAADTDKAPLAILNL